MTRCGSRLGRLFPHDRQPSLPVRGRTSELLRYGASRALESHGGGSRGPAPLEDVFRLMEGVGSYAAFRVALAHAPSGTSAPAVLSRLQPGRYWSQDIGLSIMLVLDALLPDWRAQVLREDPPSVYALLAQAAGSD